MAGCITSSVHVTCTSVPSAAQSSMLSLQSALSQIAFATITALLAHQSSESGPKNHPEILGIHDRGQCPVPSPLPDPWANSAGVTCQCHCEIQGLGDFGLFLGGTVVGGVLLLSAGIYIGYTFACDQKDSCFCRPSRASSTPPRPSSFIQPYGVITPSSLRAASSNGR